LCYKPLLHWTGFDQFSWQSTDFGFPWGCDPPGPGCYGLTHSRGAGFATIQVTEIHLPPAP
jgi:hypothetical protein